MARPLFYSLLATPYCLPLPRGPGEVAAAEQMQMQMVHGLAAVLAGIHHDAIAFGEAIPAGNLRRHPEEVTEQRVLLRSDLGE